MDRISFAQSEQIAVPGNQDVGFRGDKRRQNRSIVRIPPLYRPGSCSVARRLSLLSITPRKRELPET